MLKLLVIRTHHLDQSKFYRTIGIALAEESHGKGPVHYAGTLDDAIFEIYPNSAETSLDTTIRLGFSVTDPQQVLQSLSCLGTQIVRQLGQTTWGYRALVRDPDGRIVELYKGD